MTAPYIVDPAGLLSETLAEASPDLMRSQLQAIINQLLSADADAIVGDEWGKPSADRTAQLGGYRHRGLAAPSTPCRAVPPPVWAPSA